MTKLNRKTQERLRAGLRCFRPLLKAADDRTVLRISKKADIKKVLRRSKSATPNPAGRGRLLNWDVNQ